MHNSQSASAVLMVRPVSFGFNDQTAISNTFQHNSGLQPEELRNRADKEFRDAVQSLRAHDITVVTFEDSPNPPKPDAVFPNNWMTTWPSGVVYEYPMATDNRRLERTDTVLDILRERFKLHTINDLSAAEDNGEYLEGTGAMVFDHLHKIVYACISPRCGERLLREHAAKLGYEPIIFHAFDQHGTPIYHTNVVLAVQTTTAVVCLDAITDIAECKTVYDTLQRTNHAVISITQAQMDHFCANVIELKNGQGARFLLLSETAEKSFTPEERKQLSIDKSFIVCDVPTIETVGGGGIRCMVAELFLPRR